MANMTGDANFITAFDRDAVSLNCTRLSPLGAPDELVSEKIYPPEFTPLLDAFGKLSQEPPGHNPVMRASHKFRGKVQSQPTLAAPQGSRLYKGLSLAEPSVDNSQVYGLRSPHKKHRMSFDP